MHLTQIFLKIVKFNLGDGQALIFWDDLIFAHWNCTLTIPIKMNVNNKSNFRGFKSFYSSQLFKKIGGSFKINLRSPDLWLF